ncbi:MAG: NADH:flavin oxidoreductase [Deltaproteobacteria bacterium]|nr:NADH:flavin oxidoreductase [Deltaproteobacteria bacterium]MBW2448205.1 NADH:flavin oxidoreductase [Deltaproteobacteria bacterium]
MTDPVDRCFAPAQLNGLTLRNRLIKAATFEGKTKGGVLSEELIRLHERMGEGGVGMTTLAYCAAEADGRINEDMIYMHEGVRAGLEALVARMHATGAKVSGQLGHCGNFSKNREFQGKRPLGPSRGINSLGLAYGLPFAGALSQTQIRERVAVMGRAAGFMKSVGFDAVEVHFGHGYGISQFISPRTNKRTDEYGGGLTNRMRFGLECLEAIRAEVGDDFPLLAKISMTDGVRGGTSVDDAVEIAAMLEAGGIDAIICSGGTSSMNPMLLFRGDSLAPGLIENEEKWILKIGMKLVGERMFREYPYEEAYFLDEARRIRERVQCGVCYIGGVCTTESIRTVMSEGFDFIQIGRGLIFDPDMPKRAQERADYRNGCDHCNRCATLIDTPDGISCVLRPDNFVSA